MEFQEMLRILQNPPDTLSVRKYRQYEAAWNYFMEDFRSVMEATVVKYCGRNKFGTNREYRDFIDDCVAEVLLILVKDNNRAICRFKGTTRAQFASYLWIITKNATYKLAPRDYTEGITEGSILPQSTRRDIFNEISVRIREMQNIAEKKGRKAKNRHRDSTIYFFSDQLVDLGLGGFTDQEICRIPFLQDASENVVRLAKFRIRRLLQLSGGKYGL